MAGRGVDIKLGGNAEEIAKQKYLKDGSEFNQNELDVIVLEFKKK